MLNDRLIWFLGIGLALFVAEGFYNKSSEYVIAIDLPLVQKLATQWQAQTKTPPNPRELDALIEGYIREEILVREAARLGLDGDDIIVRRRLAQKVEFFLSDTQAPPVPDEAALRGFYKTYESRYETPPRVSFRHVFVPDEAAGQTALAALAAGQNWRILGLPFMLQREYGNSTRADLAELFGQGFADDLFTHAKRDVPDDWFGAVRSAYGWHVVQVVSSAPRRLPDFETLIVRVAQDWQTHHARIAKEQAWADLRAQYDVQMLPIEDQ